MSTLAPAPPYDPETARVELRAIRRELRLTQAQLGARMGVDANTIARYERGVREVPRMALRLAQSLRDGPREVVRISKRSRRPARKGTRWDVAFVLVCPVEAPCLHGPVEGATEGLATPCAGVHYQFVALLPPSAYIHDRRTETVTCEQHAYHALYWLRHQYSGWMSRIFGPRHRDWFGRWVQTLQRYGNVTTPEKETS